ncbi:hypothetical protein ACFX2I_023396 [Malus domestica]
MQFEFKRALTTLPLPYIRLLRLRKPRLVGVQLRQPEPVLHGAESNDKLITVTRFHWIKITKKDFDDAFRGADHNRQASQASEFRVMSVVAAARNYGMMVSGFYELEPVFTDYWNTECGPKVWCVGPLFLMVQNKPHDDHGDKPTWVEWLDKTQEEGSRVLYVVTS